MFELIYPAEPAPLLPPPTFDNPGGKPVPGCELLPVIDTNGLVIGQTMRKMAHKGTKLLHPVVHLHIIDRMSRLCLQKRSMSKDLLPGKWDTAVGGHVDYGERLEEALYRETAEELGLRQFNPLYLKSYVWETPVEKEMVNVYAVVGSFELSPEPKEIDQLKWWTFEEIDDSMGTGIFTPNFEHEFGEIRKTLLSLL